jgi:hypothetical protein
MDAHLTREELVTRETKTLYNRVKTLKAYMKWELGINPQTNRKVVLRGRMHERLGNDHSVGYSYIRADGKIDTASISFSNIHVITQTYATNEATEQYFANRLAYLQINPKTK